MHHFFLPPDCFMDQQVVFPAQTTRQMAGVLRLKTGEKVVALDNLGTAYLVELQEVTGKRVTGRQIELLTDLAHEPALYLTLYVSLTQREKFEWILQKGTELGVSTFVPLILSRSLVQSAREAESKRGRWETIVREAAEQCGRLRIPLVGPVLPWRTAVSQAVQQNTVNVVLWESETATPLVKALAWTPGLKQVGLFIGPEGGISDEEITLAREAGLPTATLGRRVLRVETAAIAAVALAMYLAHEMG